MTKTPKDCDKIISVLFRKAYVGLKSISCITFFASLVVSPVASQSEGPWFESHANLLKKKNKNKNNKNKKTHKKQNKKTFLYYNGENLSVIISL